MSSLAAAVAAERERSEKERAQIFASAIELKADAEPQGRRQAEPKGRREAEPKVEELDDDDFLLLPKARPAAARIPWRQMAQQREAAEAAEDAEATEATEAAEAAVADVDVSADPKNARLCAPVDYTRKLLSEEERQKLEEHSIKALEGVMGGGTTGTDVSGLQSYEQFRSSFFMLEPAAFPGAGTGAGAGGAASVSATETTAPSMTPELQSRLDELSEWAKQQQQEQEQEQEQQEQENEDEAGGNTGAASVEADDIFEESIELPTGTVAGRMGWGSPRVAGAPGVVAVDNLFDNVDDDTDDDNAEEEDASKEEDSSSCSSDSDSDSETEAAAAATAAGRSHSQQSGLRSGRTAMASCTTRARAPLSTRGRLAPSAARSGSTPASSPDAPSAVVTPAAPATTPATPPAAPPSVPVTAATAATAAGAAQPEEASPNLSVGDILGDDDDDDDDWGTDEGAEDEASGGADSELQESTAPPQDQERQDGLGGEAADELEERDGWATGSRVEVGEEGEEETAHVIRTDADNYFEEMQQQREDTDRDEGDSTVTAAPTTASLPPAALARFGGGGAGPAEPGTEAEMEEVHAFSIDPNFDYDNCTLTPLATPSQSQ